MQGIKAFGQDEYQWWNIKHNWDGYSHWASYMILSPAYLGPNALPVPDLYPASIPSSHSFEIGTEGHYSKGDQTANLYTAYTLPLFSDRASLQISYRPVEIYQTDTLTRDRRISRQKDPSGYSLGDVYLSTYIQAIKQHAFLPDLMLSVNLRTASGTNLYAARYTDTPGYWMDATIGKSWKLKTESFSQIRIYGKIGFYAYQTYHVKFFQDDAFLYGLGIQSILGKFSLQNQLTGYSGYMKNGDRPMVYRLLLESKIGKNNSLILIFQQGIRDFNFSSVRLSARIGLNEIEDP